MSFRSHHIWDAVIACTLLTVLAFGAIGLSRGSRQSSPSPEERPWVIPPAREAASMALAKVAAASLPNHAVRGVSAQKTELRVVLSGPLTGPIGSPPVWAKPPALAISTNDGRTLRVRVFGLARAQHSAIEGAIRDHYQQNIWVQPRDNSPGKARAHEASDDAWSGQWGIMTPALVWARKITGLRPAPFVLAWWVVALLLTVLATRFSHVGDAPVKERSTGRFVIAGLALVAVAVAVRVFYAIEAPPETDEYRVYTAHAVVFDGDHDAWLHPPLFRAVQLQWVQWTGTESMFLFRTPAFILSAIACALFVVALLRRSSAWTTVAAALPFSLGLGLTHATALARPYALATCLFVLLVGLLFTGKRNAVRTGAVVVACGLLFWVNTLFGVAGAITLVAALAWDDGQRGRGWSRIVVVGAVLFWALPTLPGAAQATLSPTLPGQTSQSVARGQQADNGMGRGSLIRLTAATASLTAFGADSERGALGLLALLIIAGLVTLAVADRAARMWAVALIGCFGLAIIAGSVRSVRPRNVLFLVPLFCVVATIALPVAVSRLRQLRG